MSNEPRVATKVSVGTKVAVAVLLLAGLGALGYASGYVKLDYQQSKATADEALEQCDCLYECAMDRQECMEDGYSAEDCNAGAGACLDECLPKEDPREECTELCKQAFSQCKQAGGTDEECAEKGADCLCECDPYFAPSNVDNSCVDSCLAATEQCEDSSAQQDCLAAEESCLMDCPIWCEDRDKPDDQEEERDLPDLSVTDIFTNSEGILVIQTENLGTMDVTDTSGHTYIYKDGQLEKTYSWSSFSDQDFLKAAGLSTIEYGKVEGEPMIEACVDANDIIVELDEQNNCFKISDKKDDQPGDDTTGQDDKPDDEPDDSAGPNDEPDDSNEPDVQDGTNSGNTTP